MPTDAHSKPDANAPQGRFRFRIRDLLVLVVLIALGAAVVSQYLRDRRRQAELAAAEQARVQAEIERTLRDHERTRRKADALLKKVRELVPGESPREKWREGVFPDPDPERRADTGRIVL